MTIPGNSGTWRAKLFRVKTIQVLFSHLHVAGEAVQTGSVCQLEKMLHLGRI